MVFETYTVPILIDNFARIVEIGVFVDNSGCWFEYIDKKHSEKEPQQEGQQLDVVKKTHPSTNRIDNLHTQIRLVPNHKEEHRYQNPEYCTELAEVKQENTLE